MPIYHSEITLSKEMKDDSSAIEHFKRRLFADLINEIPLEDLEKMFNFTDIDPLTPGIEAFVQWDKLDHLKRGNMAIFRAYIKIDK